MLAFDVEGKVSLAWRWNYTCTEQRRATKSCFEETNEHETFSPCVSVLSRVPGQDTASQNYQA